MERKIANLFIAIITFVMLTAFDCKNDYKTMTKINSDGSCMRTVVVNPVSDTSSSFPIPTDKSWETRLEGDTEKVYVASKKFDDVNQMNNEYKRGEKVGVDIIGQVEKWAREQKGSGAAGATPYQFAEKLSAPRVQPHATRG